MTGGANSGQEPGPRTGLFAVQGSVKTFDEVDPSVLQSIPHRGGAVEIRHETEELTFLGVPRQPDFASLNITFYPHKRLIELKSLKEYLLEFRDVAVSYERAIDVIYSHLMDVYEPARLRLVMTTRTRGGIRSTLTIDSDWAIRGGREEFKDWRD